MQVSNVRRRGSALVEVIQAKQLYEQMRRERFREFGDTRVVLPDIPPVRVNKLLAALGHPQAQTITARVNSWSATESMRRLKSGG